MPTRYETERVVVRDWELRDAEDAYDIYRREEVQRWLAAQPVPNLNAMRERLAGIIDRHAGQTLGAWAVEEKATGRVIGMSLLKPLPDDPRIEVGWHLHPDRWGLGLAREFGAGAIRHGFQDLGLVAIHAIVRPDNERSRRVAFACGLRLEGRTDRFHGMELEFYRLLRSEWASE